MTNTEMIALVDLAVADVIKNETNTLTRGLNERTISTHLSNYLKPYFKGYDIDHEYNGDIDKPNDRKALDIASNRLNEIGKKTNLKANYKLSPDIIVHKRGTNKNNLIVIEVKKDSSPDRDKEFDLIKLEHLTIDYLGNHYNYKLGIALSFGTGKNTGDVNKVYFQNGILRDIDQL
jgi:hypothetical protein